MSFEYEGEATVSSVALKKEGKEPERVLAVEIGVGIMVERDFLANFSPTLGAFLWDTDGEPRYPSMGPIEWGGTVVHMEIEIMALSAMEVTLEKFEIQPISKGRAAVTFRARWRPESRDVAIVSESLVQPDVEIKLTPMPQLDLEEKVPLSAVVRKRNSKTEATA